MKIIQNGVWSNTRKPVYQIGVEDDDGNITVVYPVPMNKAEAEARLAKMSSSKETKPKKVKATKKAK